MNVLQKCWYRTFQNCFKAASGLMPWRKPEILEGEGSILKVGEIIKAKGLKKAIIVTGPHISQTNMLDNLYKGLTDNGIEYVVFNKTVQNPTIDVVENALAEYKANGCECIIALGGGSSMDSAKGMGARLARPKKPIPKLKGVLKVMHRLPLFFAIPTTAGSGSEATIAAVISDPTTHEKYAINDLNLIPDYAVLEPSLTVSLRPFTTATTGMDALTHAVEALVGNSNTKGTHADGLKACKLIFENLETAYTDGTNIEARNNMLIGSFYAGCAFTRAYVGYVHALAHQLGGMYNVPHGLANAVILPFVLEYYGSTIYKKMAEIADYCNIPAGPTDKEKCEAVIARIKQMNADMNIPTVIPEIKEEDIPTMAKRAYAEANPLYPVPKLMGITELETMYRMLMPKAE